MSKRPAGSSRQAGNLWPADVILVDASGNPIVFGTLPTGAATEATLSTLTGEIGATTDVKVTADNAGSLSGKIRNLNRIFSDVYDSLNHQLKGFAPEVGYSHPVRKASHFPLANVQATCTIATPGIDYVNVCTSMTVMLSAVGGGTAPPATQLSWKLLEGNSGSTTVLDGGVIAIPAIAGAMAGVVKSRCWIPCFALDTPMTLEFSAAAGAFIIQSVAMAGTFYIAPVS